MKPVNDPALAPRRRGRPPRGVRDAVLAATRALIREDGLVGATGSAIAARAGASEASIHYHFGGKEALLEAAILQALEPVRGREAPPPAPDDDCQRDSMLELAMALESSYDELVPLLVAVQSDPELRHALAPRLSAHDLGPHRAVTRLARRLAADHPDRGSEDGIDAEAAALLIVGACFLRAWQRQMSTHRSHRLPSLARAINVLLERAGE